jgi:hypothetical protein
MRGEAGLRHMIQFLCGGAIAAGACARCLANTVAVVYLPNVILTVFTH